MAYHDFAYDTYVILGDPDLPALWNWSAWKRLLPDLDPLIKVARGKPAVRCSQFLPNKGGDVKFGRIGWKESDHHKWTHGSPTNRKDSKLWQFMELQVWAPAWTVCDRDQQPPDVFLCLSDQSLPASSDTKLLFNPVVVLAVASETARREASLVSTVLASLRKLTSPKLMGYKQRPWAEPFGSIGFTNSIDDMTVYSLFKPGRRHDGDVGFHRFAEEWEPVSLDGNIR